MNPETDFAVGDAVRLRVDGSPVMRVEAHAVDFDRPLGYDPYNPPPQRGARRRAPVGRTAAWAMAGLMTLGQERSRSASPA